MATATEIATDLAGHLTSVGSRDYIALNMGYLLMLTLSVTAIAGFIGESKISSVFGLISILLYIALWGKEYPQDFERLEAFLKRQK